MGLSKKKEDTPIEYAWPVTPSNGIAEIQLIERNERNISKCLTKKLNQRRFNNTAPATDASIM